MANILYANNAAGTLSASITNLSTALTLNAGQGALFPVPVPPQVFYITLTDAATQTLIEIVKVTAVAGDVFSITRAQDGTSALSWNVGDIVSQRAIRLEMQGWQNGAEGNFAAQVTTITPSTTLGITGTTLADNANTGKVGEFLTNTNGFGITSGVPINVAAVTLTPGDWDVWGLVGFLPVGGAVLVQQVGGVSLTSGAFSGIFSNLLFVAPANAGSSVTPPQIRVNVSSNTPVFMVAQGSFSPGTCTAQGSIFARRVR